MTSETQSKAPSHIAYQVRESKKGGKGFWTRIGAQWPHKDGKGYDLQLECVPLDGRVSIRLTSESK